MTITLSEAEIELLLTSIFHQVRTREDTARENKQFNALARSGGYAGNYPEVADTSELRALARRLMELPPLPATEGDIHAQ